MTFRWQMSDPHESVWLQNEAGRFFGVQLGALQYSEQSGDLEQFDPKRCPKCEDAAGWLPSAFSYCPLCGGTLSAYCRDEAAMGEVHWPMFAFPAEAKPSGPADQHGLPRGTGFTFVRLRQRNRLIALDGDSGQVWVWSRPAGEWRALLDPPTGHHDIPHALFGALTTDALLVYPTREGAVWIDTSASGPARADVSNWRPLGAAALLAGRIVMPALSENGRMCLASRYLDLPGKWTLSEVDEAPASEGWLSRPAVAVEDGEAHWVGRGGLLGYHQSGRAGWKGWSHHFNAVLGTQVLETCDGRLWQIGHAPNEHGETCWAFSRVAARAAPECRLVDGTYFSASRLCFRFAERYLVSPWNDSSSRKAAYRTEPDSFLVPLCAIGDEGALVLRFKDQSAMPVLLEGKVEAIMRGELFLSRTPGSLQSLEVALQCDGRQWPQVFMHNHKLFVYDLVGGNLYTWSTQV
jgi:hypothetical protein